MMQENDGSQNEIAVRMEPKMQAIRDAEQKLTMTQRQMSPNEVLEGFLSRYAMMTSVGEFLAPQW